LTDPTGVLNAIVEHLHSIGCRSIYFSNDIDGTDESFADATGTPEARGLEPAFVVRLIQRLGQEFGIIGGDVTEIAPTITPHPDSASRTVELGVTYLRSVLSELVGTRI